MNVTSLSATVTELSNSHGITLPLGTKNARKLLRNAVDPLLGLHVFNAVGLQKSVVLTGEQIGFSELAKAPTSEEK